ncbi:MAG: hypothetical protein KBB54_03945 [Candidatus Pacebacteria bacterium]|nr:hypothetical protein [Candidatus Paceibacterota bacterium]MBP9818500.1 hypothetical protein [Candidatus Paceibacterota bacterium]
MNILFLCRGNVGRSQMAEGLLKKHNPNLNVSSAGTKLSGPEQKLIDLMPAISEVLQVMKEVDIDVSDNIRKQVTEEMVDKADRIIMVIDERDPVPEYLINNPKVITWNVLDPKGQSLEFTRNTRKQIDALIKSLF